MNKDNKNIYKDTQRMLVGTLLAYPKDVDEVISIVDPDDFSDPSLAVIFSSIASLARRDEKVSAFSVASDLESKGNLDNVGGLINLEELRYGGEDWSTELPSRVFAAIVKDGSVKEKVSELITESKEGLTPDSGVSARDGIETLQNSLNEALYSISDETTITKLNENIDQYLELIERRKEVYEQNKGKSQGLQGIPSNIESINNYTTGWLPGQLITVAARTSIGKTVVAVNSAVAAARANKSVMFFSLEMGADEIQDRIYSSVSSVPMKELKQGNMSPESEEWLKESIEEFRELKIEIDVDPDITVDNIRAKAIKQAQSEAGLDMIIIDYLQLITPVGNHNNRQEQVRSISRGVKLLAKQLDVPIMVLAQLNKEKEDSEDGIPRMDEIRESYAIAQDSDIVILLHRNTKTDDPDPRTLFILEKNRNGENNKIITCRSDLACSKFEEIRRLPGEDNGDFASDEPLMSEEEYNASIQSTESMLDDFHNEDDENDDGLGDLDFN